MSLLDACHARYGLEGCTLRPLVGGLSDHTYAVERVGAETLVLRVERPGLGGMPTHEQVLLFLEENGYPAPVVIRALDGAPVVEHEDSKLILTSFIEGVIVESEANTPEVLYKLGGTLGRLHALDPRRELPTADFMPEKRIGWAQAQLAAIADRVPAEWRYRYHELLQSLAAVPSLRDVPLRVIHNDCHPGNAVLQADGEVVLMDWDGAGLGAAVLDLGFLLITAFTETPDVPSVGSSEARLSAIVDGYGEYRCPDEAELEQLATAICFRVTLINTGAFTYLASRDELERLPTVWWNGCETATEVAAAARRRFQEHRAARSAPG